jgi:hypothetical protein
MTRDSDIEKRELLSWTDTDSVIDEVKRLQAQIAELEMEIDRLKVEKAAQKVEMQKLYDNWVRVLNLPEGA